MGIFTINGRPVYGRVFSIYTIDWSTKPPLDQSIEGIFTIDGRPVYGGVISQYTVDQSREGCFPYIR